MTLRFELEGQRKAFCLEYAVDVPERKSPIPYLARRLRDEGYPGDEMVEVYRNGTLCFHPKSLQSWADIQVLENDERIKVTKYVPFPDKHKK